MTGDNPRVLELRRRVQTDPASIAFAQLAEECRRKGDNDEAVGICRAGLAYHPGYLSARVTLGRALVELGRLDEAQTELMVVLARAPDSLAANRAIAEMYQLRGQLSDALVHYKRALELAQHDPDLEHQVERIENLVSPPPPPAPKQASTPTAIEDLFDFDTLLEQLGGRPQSQAESTPSSMATPAMVAPSPIDAVELIEDDSDPFSRLERQLRDSDEQRGYEDVVASAPDERAVDQRVMAELEDWLFAIVIDREQRASA
ncbi:MAG: tetratricopeptide repeat protein [Vicinamibacterales bacterium]